ncbi:MAG: TetR/AcrR family transcriptional regulator [Actinomycetota bacterium]
MRQRAIVGIVAKPSGRDIKAEVLTEARHLIQRSGVARLSYGNVADSLGIRAPSIHHHFRRKDDLVADVVARYRVDFQAKVDAIDETSVADAPARLLGYAALFDEVADAGLLCLCGAVAAEWNDAAVQAQGEVGAFFDDQVAWLTAEVERGKGAGDVEPEVDAAAFALALLAALEGSLLLQRAGRGSARAVGIAESLLAGISAPR